MTEKKSESTQEALLEINGELQEINPDAVTSGVDYKTTANMRMQLAMSQVQKYAAMADFDDDADALRKEWGAYYKAIKPLVAEESYEEVFKITLPLQA